MSQITQWPLCKVGSVAGSVAASMRAPHIRASHFANNAPTSPTQSSLLFHAEVSFTPRYGFRAECHLA